MRNGETVSRRYDSIPISKDDLKDPDSFASRLLAFLEEPEVMWKNYLTWGWSGSPEVLSAVGGSIRDYGSGENRNLEYEEAQTLWRAIQEDINAGRYHRYLFYGEAGPSTRDIQISLDLYGSRVEEETGENVSDSMNLYIMVQSTATSTMAAMEELGYRETGK